MYSVADILSHARKAALRIDSSVDIVTESGCWIWTKGLNTNGYGKLSFMGVTTQAHRLSYELHSGQIPEGHNVLHRCDVRCCVNPDHLFLGSQADNIKDMVEKGRKMCGENYKTAKLTNADAAAILNDERPNSVIAKQYGVSRVLVSDIKAGKRWKHVAR